MGLFQWRSKGTQDTEAPSLIVGAACSQPSGAETEGAGGLDFASAIRVHRELKMRLQRHLSRQSLEMLDARSLCRDDWCVLGKWIHGSGASEFGHLPSFAELKAAHNQFHRTAGRIVQLHDEMRSDEAAQLLRQGDYSHQSHKVVVLLSSLYVEVADTLHGDSP